MVSLKREIALSTPSSRRGKILRLKCGYNPNSSSIGSVVFLLSSKMLAFSAAFGLAAGLIYSWFDRSSNTSSSTSQPIPQSVACSGDEADEPRIWQSRPLPPVRCSRSESHCQGETQSRLQHELHPLEVGALEFV